MATLSPRVDWPFQSTRPEPVGVDSRTAKAEGLPEDEAFMLATWLRSSGYDSVEVIEREGHATVLWSK